MPTPESRACPYVAFSGDGGGGYQEGLDECGNLGVGEKPGSVPGQLLAAAAEAGRGGPVFSASPLSCICIYILPARTTGFLSPGLHFLPAETSPPRLPSSRLPSPACPLVKPQRPKGLAAAGRHLSQRGCWEAAGRDGAKSSEEPVSAEYDSCALA